MPTAKQLSTVRKIAARLRELRPYLDRISDEIEEERTLLPERHWRTEIDDDVMAASIALDNASQSLTDALAELAEVTGEDDPVQHRALPAMPLSLPTYEEVDAQRRQRAKSIIEQRKSPSE